jgi:hypothetical protein
VRVRVREREREGREGVRALIGKNPKNCMAPVHTHMTHTYTLTCTHSYS